MIRRFPTKLQKFYDNKRISSLSQKFQLHENLRSFEFIKNAFVCSAYIVVIACAVHVSIRFKLIVQNPFKLFAKLRYCNITYNHAIVVPFVGARCNPVWMRDYNRLTNHCFPWRRQDNKVVHPIANLPNNVDANAISECYFQQLKIEWN
uniref:Uncharacterized protein n=1 Tax=Ascaris lumbricoides TaxID=6252 RepID=A0A0M3IM30_ASCLU